MLTLRFWLASIYGLSARTLKAALLAVVWPTGMVMVWPLLKVTTKGLPVTAFDTVAV